jgi:hypothetical protein
MSNAKQGITLSGYITWFVVLTTIFFIIKYSKLRCVDPNDTSGTSFGWSGGYIVVCLIWQFIMNLTIASGFCKNATKSYFSVFMYTMLPNFLILGSIIVLISALPGWISPFSNTIGYFFVSMQGLTRNFNAMLKTDMGDNRLMKLICSDESLAINEMTPDNYSNFMKTLSFGDSAVLKPEKDLLRMPQYIHLYKLVVMKTMIAEWMWYLLAGCLTLTISVKSISALQCEYSIEEMKKTVDDLHDQQAAAEIADKKKNKESQYTVS